MRKLLTNRIVLVLAILLGSLSTLMASTVDTAFEHYNNKEYAMAAELYHSLVDSGYANDEVYYNLGNCYYKMEDFPSAILYFEKAIKQNQYNEDAQHNLELATKLHTDKIEEVPTLFLKRWDQSLTRLFPKAWWTVITMIFFGFLLISIGGVVLSARYKRLFLFLTVFNIATSAFAGIYAVKEYRYQNKQQSAIVFTPTLNVKSSPDEGSATLFVIHEGTKVRILDYIGQWHQVQIADGSRGWIQKEDFKGI